MRLVNPAACPPQNPTYSQAAVSGNVVYVSGQIGIGPDGALVASDAGAQTRRIFQNAKVVLEEAGSSLSRLLRVTVYLVDMADWAAMNAAFQEALMGHAPPKTTVQVSGLALGARVEIEFTAELGSEGTGERAAVSTAESAAERTSVRTPERTTETTAERAPEA